MHSLYPDSFDLAEMNTAPTFMLLQLWRNIIGTFFPALRFQFRPMCL